MHRQPVAIVGIGVRVAGAGSPQALWKLLCDGVDSTAEIPSTRWDMRELYDPAPDRAGKIRSRRAALLDDVHSADPAAFRLGKRELRQMDPQHRLLLEAAWLAFEDAGIPLDALRGSRTGVFAGINFTDFQKLLARDWSAVDGYTVLGTTPSFAANRISYAFDLRGPSTCVSVGCASSTSAVHEACRALALGEADLAVAGGVELLLSPDSSIMLSQAGVLSAQGKCRTLDASADGYVRGEGVGMVVLKPLSKVDATDRVYAVIRGSAVNHNGRNDWIMAPSLGAQADVITEACARGGVSASSLDYVDLHGSAFLRGDALEAAAIAQAIGSPAPRSSCRLGAISNNIGYLGAAGGIAQLIKVCLALHHRTLPPTIHVDTPNPQIAFDQLGLEVQTRLEPWPVPERGRHRRAGVISTSLGGSNAFVVVEEASEARRARGTEGEGFVLALSAHTAAALEQRVLDFAAFLRDTGDECLEDICHTAAFKRQHLAHRAAFVARDKASFAEQLDRFTRSPAPASFAQEAMPHALVDSARVYVDDGYVPLTALSGAGWRCVSLPSFPFQRQPLWPAWLTPAEVSRGPKPPRKAATTDPGSMALPFDIHAVPAPERTTRFLQFLREQMAEVLDVSVDAVDTRKKTLFELGLTSVGVFMFAHRMARALAISVPPTLVFEHPRLEALCEWFLAQLDAAPAAPHVEVEADWVREIGQLTDQEARDRIEQKLREISLEVDL